MNYNTLVGELLRVYYEEETWHKNKLSKEEAIKYHNRLIEKDAIIYRFCEGRLLGYLEVWRLDFAKFGRLICEGTLSAYLEDIEHGNIAYLANIWIDKKFRNSNMIRDFRTEFFVKYADCDYFVGESRTKKSAPIKVFKRQEYYDKYLKRS